MLFLYGNLHNLLETVEPGDPDLKFDCSHRDDNRHRYWVYCYNFHYGKLRNRLLFVHALHLMDSNYYDLETMQVPNLDS